MSYICLEEKRKRLKLAVVYSKAKASKMFKKNSPAVPLSYLHTKTDEGKKNKFGTLREADFLPVLYLYIQSSEVYAPMDGLQD